MAAAVCLADDAFIATRHLGDAIMQTESATAVDVQLPLDGLPAERQGCGWFDSSYELRHGITVVEGVDMNEYLLCEAVRAMVH